MKKYKLSVMLYDVETDEHIEETVSTPINIRSAIYDARQCAMNHEYFQGFEWNVFKDIVHHFQLTELRPDSDMYDTMQSYAKCNLEEIFNDIPKDLEQYKY